MRIAYIILIYLKFKVLFFPCTVIKKVKHHSVHSVNRAKAQYLVILPSHFHKDTQFMILTFRARWKEAIYCRVIKKTIFMNRVVI